MKFILGLAVGAAAVHLTYRAMWAAEEKQETLAAEFMEELEDLSEGFSGFMQNVIGTIIDAIEPDED